MIDIRILIELYETAYGTHDHIANGTLFGSASFHESENYLKDNIYEAYLTTYIYKDVYRKTGLNFDEFLNRPKYEIEAILKVVTEVANVKSKTEDDLYKSLENKSKS